jgi:hypothetical protein
MQLNWAPIFFQSLKNCSQNHTKNSTNQNLFFPKTKVVFKIKNWTTLVCRWHPVRQNLYGLQVTLLHTNFGLISSHKTQPSAKCTRTFFWKFLKKLTHFDRNTLHHIWTMHSYWLSKLLGILTFLDLTSNQIWLIPLLMVSSPPT